jgi:Neurotransmitter-gated ion-channel ligand binding domain
VNAWNETDVDKLKADLLKGYDRLTRPAQFKEKTFCEIGVTLININLDETRGVLTSHAWLRMNWSDSKLSWDNESYGGIASLHVTADEVR